jgi:hypothetical protein
MRRVAPQIIRIISMHYVNFSAEVTSALFLWTRDFLAHNATKATLEPGGQKNYVAWQFAR